MSSCVVNLRANDSFEWSLIVVVALLIVEVVMLEMEGNDGMEDVWFI